MRTSMHKALLAILMSACAMCLLSPSLAFAVGEDDKANDAASSQPYHPLSIIGNDDRIRVSDTYEFPYSAIALMCAHAECGCRWEGSGFMVLPDVLLTAGHCLYCSEHHEPAKEIDFYYGYQPNGDCAYEYHGKWDSYFGTTFSGGYTSENMEWDYGIVRFYENVGDQTGYFGMKVSSDNELNGATLRVAGYRDGMLKYDTGHAAAWTDQSIKFYADTIKGNSGCPLYDGEFATAICVAENADGKYNVGHRITQDLFLKVFSMTRSSKVPDSLGTVDAGRVVAPSKTGKDGYVLPDSATYIYTRSELSSLDNWGLNIARNEIPARHGLIFDKDDLARYFAGKSWYEGKLTRSEFRSIVGILNYAEEANVSLILEIETERNSPYKPEG